MKRFILSVLSVISISAFAQDVLIKRSGDELQVMVLKISTTEIEYKKWDNQEGPTYCVPKSEVFMIKYKNGDKDVFKEETSDTPKETESNQSVSDNQALIDGYRNETHTYFWSKPTKPSKKKARGAIGTLGITSSSILSTNDIEISLRQATESESNRYWLDAVIGERFEISPANVFWSHPVKFVIEIYNKTSQNIYIDKAACFRQSQLGEKRPYYNFEGMAEYQNLRLIVIPPKGRALLSKDDYIEIEGFKDIITGASEYIEFNISDLCKKEIRQYTEENSPVKYDYTITYSLSPDLANSCHANFGVYLKDVMEAFKATGIYLKTLDQYFQKRSPKTIVVCDWFL